MLVSKVISPVSHSSYKSRSIRSVRKNGIEFDYTNSELLKNRIDFNETNSDCLKKGIEFEKINSNWLKNQVEFDKIKWLVSAFDFILFLYLGCSPLPHTFTGLFMPPINLQVSGICNMLWMWVSCWLLNCHTTAKLLITMKCMSGIAIPHLICQYWTGNFCNMSTRKRNASPQYATSQVTFYSLQYFFNKNDATSDIQVTVYALLK